jgi:hypothetical protein
MAADRPLWHLKFDGKEYVFDPRELLTVSALRSIKGWYGVELGRYLAFIAAFAQGDPEAALCAIWLCRKAAGEDGVPEPNNMPDFRMGEFYDHFQAAGEDEDPPTKAEQPTPVSTVIRTSSEPDISDS